MANLWLLTQDIVSELFMNKFNSNETFLSKPNNGWKRFWNLFLSSVFYELRENKYIKRSSYICRYTKYIYLEISSVY